MRHTFIAASFVWVSLLRLYKIIFTGLFFGAPRHSSIAQSRITRFFWFLWAKTLVMCSKKRQFQIPIYVQGSLDQLMIIGACLFCTFIFKDEICGACTVLNLLASDEVFSFDNRRSAIQDLVVANHPGHKIVETRR